MKAIFKNLTNWYKIKRQALKRSQVEAKYKSIFCALDLDFNGYKALQQLKNEELAKEGL